MKAGPRAVSVLHKIGGVCLALVLVPPPPSSAGGPLTVGGPGAGVPGVPLLWDNSKPIGYRVDAGPLSRLPNGGGIVIDNAAGVARVTAMFTNWSAVTTANLTITNLGGLLAIPAAGFPTGGDVQTAQQFLNVIGDSSGQTLPDANSCSGGGQSPIVFDADGSIFDALGMPPEVIGFAFGCDYSQITGKIISAGAILNGRFQDGINDHSSNFELTSNEFNQAFTHEFGHFLGLGHSQINVDLLLKAENGQPYTCSSDDTAGMPLMFPIIGICPAKATAGVPVVAVDDAAWISKLYPVGTSPPTGKSSYSSKYGTISGTVFFSDGVTPVQGVNVVARSVTLPRRNAVSAVSGDRFAGNPGQNRTCVDPKNPTPSTCSNLGDPFGSRDSSLIGYYEIPLPPGTYTLSLESVFAGFTGGSSLTPLDPPIPMPGTFSGTSTLSVSAGGNTTFNFTLQGTPQRFDAFESAALSGPEGSFARLRRDQLRYGWASA